MDIKNELLSNAVAEIIREHLENIEYSAENMVESKSREILSEILRVIRNENLSDFDMVEEIVCIFERYNISCSGCHDF